MYLAHPDMMYFVGDERVYEQETTRLCEFCKAHNIPLEINLLGLGGKRHYPREAFWEIAAKVGNTAIIGCDTHDHGVLKNKELQQMGKDWANKFGVTLLPSLTVK
jgi:histidinol-phosphatase (PHP family)